MYRFIVKRQLRRTFRRLSEGDYEAVLARFGPGSVFEFAGDHELGGERHGIAESREVFERMFERFPGLQVEPSVVVVNGPPWNTTVATRFAVRATLPGGRPYRNEGMQFLRLRWGRVVEDRLYEDTKKLAEALEGTAGKRSPVAPAAA